MSDVVIESFEIAVGGSDAKLVASKSNNSGARANASAEQSEKLNGVGQVKIDASDLPNVIARAMALFNEGDVLAAKSIASGAYDLAKVAGRMATGERLLAKARQMQGDALLIECRSMVAIANTYDDGQKSGDIAKQGRKKNLPDEKVLTADDLGLTYKDIYEARKLRDAEQREPGIAERAIAARLAQGLEPTRTSVRGIGTRSASKDERGDDFYQTPSVAIAALLCVEQFSACVWEPSCGHGAIAGPMASAGYDVLASDLVDRGYVTPDGICQEAIDFLETVKPPLNGRPLEVAPDFDIVTNPPFGMVNAYIYHALAAHRPRKMAMLLNLNALCGADDERRNFWMETWPPARIYVFSRRLPMMHREGYEGDKSSSQMNTAWFVWERNTDASAAQCCGGTDVNLSSPDCGPCEVYGTQTVMHRLDWEDYVGEAVLGPVGDPL